MYASTDSLSKIVDCSTPAMSSHSHNNSSESSQLSGNNIGWDSVNVTLLPSHNDAYPPETVNATTHPLMITPRWNDSPDFLQSFLMAQRGALTAQLNHRGAILIRGFEDLASSPAQMQQAIQAFQPHLHATYRGTSPRRVLDPESAPFLCSAAEVPTYVPIAQHLEMSFLPFPPAQLFFGCMQPSQSAGGETSICDFRRIGEALPLPLRQKLLMQGIRYTRTHTRHGRKNAKWFTPDVGERLGWESIFNTSSKAEVERLCQLESIPMHWTGPNQDVFQSITTTPAFHHHPVTNELVWFNHSQVFHWTTVPSELLYAFRRTNDIRHLLYALFMAAYSFIRYGLLLHRMSLQADWGDGTPISVQEMAIIRDAMHRYMIFSRWSKGDLLLLDNFSTSHGRQPTWDSGRAIAVAWAHPQAKSSAPLNPPTSWISLDSGNNVNVAKKNILDMQIIHSVGNPQERTPESTLTKQDATTLNGGSVNHLSISGEASLQSLFKISSSSSSSAASVSNANPQELYSESLS